MQAAAFIIRSKNRKCSVEKNSDRGSQETGRQSELIGGKPPIAK
jgi:hypothetical protein